ncbi:phosphonate C-P lyase system protein PhnH [Aeromicrobium sp. CTD01-1L150]|uniref:phosphonate C-P lyase system protein PhnH n=1 Tax=Aeromicrobium sp. CTD01-1L150 TaxID=3341830 RepID=UPI0035C1F949
MSLTKNHLPGFAEPVHDAQRTFRAVLEAMARPTLPQVIAPVLGGALRTPAPLGATAGAVLLSLCDEQTPLWLDRPLRASADVCAWLRFHTGAPLVDEPREAVFAVAASPSGAPRLADLAQGTDEEPHRSATLVIDSSGARGTSSLVASGPGVQGDLVWDGVVLPDDFLEQWEANRALFPRGVDVILAVDTTVRALPRTTMLRGNA